MRDRKNAMRGKLWRRWLVATGLCAGWLAGGRAAQAQDAIPAPLHGVTIDSKHDVRKPAVLSRTLESLQHLSTKPTVRIVYPPGNKQGYFPAASYLEATKRLQGSAYVFAQPVDSFYMRCFTPAEHLARFREFVQTLGPSADIWEVGNEINGEWLFGDTRRCRPRASVGATSQTDVVTKMTEAYDYLKSQGKITALTLYYNTPCHRPEANEMFAWVEANVPYRMRQGLDYLLVSYYEVDCEGHRPNWDAVFGRLSAMFPNSRLGISEFGRSQKRPPDAVLRDLLDRHYAIHPRVPNWVGGGFYWQFGLDMVPYRPAPDSRWSAINRAMERQE